MATRTKPTKTKAKTWLKSHGHNAAVVDALSLSSAAEITAGVCQVHSVTPAQYLAGKR